jgi:hypothetical protein
MNSSPADGADSLSVEDLVAYALFDLDPRVNKAARPVHSFLVSLALFSTQDGLYEEELYERVTRLLPIDRRSISPPDVRQAIDLHLRLDLAYRDEAGALHLTARRRSQLADARARVARNRAIFDAHLVNSVKAYGVELTVESETLLSAQVEHRIVDMLQKQSATLAAAWASSGAGFEAGLPDLNTQEYILEIANLVAPGPSSRNKLDRVCVATGLEEAFRTIPDAAGLYLAALYQQIVAMALLKQDPAISRVRNHLASKRVAYLDTNILIAAMAIHDPTHEIAREVIDLTRAVGAKAKSYTVFAGRAHYPPA